MSKKFQFGLTLVCLIGVLTIFIAPSINMPETVLSLHHSARAASVTPAGAAAVPITGLLAIQHQTPSFCRARGTGHLLGPAFQKVSVVMRC